MTCEIGSSSCSELPTLRRSNSGCQQPCGEHRPDTDSCGGHCCRTDPDRNVRKLFGDACNLQLSKPVLSFSCKATAAAFVLLVRVRPILRAVRGYGLHVLGKRVSPDNECRFFSLRLRTRQRVLRRCRRKCCWAVRGTTRRVAIPTRYFAVVATSWHPLRLNCRFWARIHAFCVRDLRRTSENIRLRGPHAGR